MGRDSDGLHRFSDSLVLMLGHVPSLMEPLPVNETELQCPTFPPDAPRRQLVASFISLVSSCLVELSH